MRDEGVRGEGRGEGVRIGIEGVRVEGIRWEGVRGEGVMWEGVMGGGGELEEGSEGGKGVRGRESCMGVMVEGEGVLHGSDMVEGEGVRGEGMMGEGVRGRE